MLSYTVSFSLRQSKIPFVPVKFIDICSDTQSIYTCTVVDHSFSIEGCVVELLYCTHHERVYDAIEHQWIPFVRGEVRLVLFIYPRRGGLHIRKALCDVCVRVSLRCFGGELESS